MGGSPLVEMFMRGEADRAAACSGARPLPGRGAGAGSPPQMAGRMSPLLGDGVYCDVCNVCNVYEI